jgi:hypothetical protein
MESGDWGKDLAAGNLESVNLVGVSKKLMEPSLMHGPGNATTQSAGWAVS